MDIENKLTTCGVTRRDGKECKRCRPCSLHGSEGPYSAVAYALCVASVWDKGRPSETWAVTRGVSSVWLACGSRKAMIAAARLLAGVA